jgi:hypothetical protein
MRTVILGLLGGAVALAALGALLLAIPRATAHLRPTSTPDRHAELLAQIGLFETSLAPCFPPRPAPNAAAGDQAQQYAAVHTFRVQHPAFDRYVTWSEQHNPEFKLFPCTDALRNETLLTRYLAGP